MDDWLFRTPCDIPWGTEIFGHYRDRVYCNEWIYEYGELKVEQLKKELAERGLSTSGLKAEPQLRLKSAMEKAGLNFEDYEFLDEQGSRSTVEEKQPVADNGQMMAMLQQMILQQQQMMLQMKN